jgi:phosphoglycolate phosphatase
MTRPFVALFDIDGTLIDAGGAGRASMEQAFLEIGGSRELGDFRYGGMTDVAIARQGLEKIGKATDENIALLVERYLHHLSAQIEKSERFRVHAGVHTLLDLLDRVAHAAVGLGTGNVIRGAELKLRRGDLWHRFGFGGYGSDHEDRAKLLAAGAARGRARLGDPTARVVVIGDTPKDVAAAKAIGATTIAVATGTFAAEELAATGAELVTESLEDPRVREALEVA